MTRDPLAIAGMAASLAIVVLFVHIYIWPHVNPFRYKWFDDTVKAVEEAAPLDKNKYSFAKVIYPTYR